MILFSGWAASHNFCMASMQHCGNSSSSSNTASVTSHENQSVLNHSNMTICLTVCLGWHQRPTLLALCEGLHGDQFSCHDVIMAFNKSQLYDTKIFFRNSKPYICCHGNILYFYDILFLHITHYSPSRFQCNIRQLSKLQVKFNCCSFRTPT